METVDQKNNKKKTSLSSPLTYTVKDSDTLSSIAVKFSVDPWNLKRINKITDSFIFPGDVLKIPTERFESSNGAMKPMESKTPRILDKQGSLDSPNKPIEPSNIPVEKYEDNPDASNDTDNSSSSRFMKFPASILMNDDLIPGVILITPDIFMFDPDENCPQVVQTGSSKPFTVVVPIEYCAVITCYDKVTRRKEVPCECSSDMTLSPGIDDLDVISQLLKFGDIRCQNFPELKHDNNDSFLFPTECSSDDVEDLLMRCFCFAENVSRRPSERQKWSAVNNKLPFPIFNLRNSMYPDPVERLTHMFDLQDIKFLDIRDHIGDEMKISERDKKQFLMANVACESLSGNELDCSICMQISKQVFKRNPYSSLIVLQKCLVYWFTLSKSKSASILSFFTAWKSNDNISAEDSQVFTMNTDENNFKSKRLLLKEDSALIRDWEVISSKYSSEDIDSFLNFTRSIRFHTASCILNEDQIDEISKCVPLRLLDAEAKLVFTTERDGFHIMTMYRRMKQYEDGHNLIVIKDSAGVVFGALISANPRISNGFYGTGESFLFTFKPDFRVYEWTGTSSFFLQGSNLGLGIGSGSGDFGLWIDADMLHGRTKACDTYKNDLLTYEEEFRIAVFELWTFSAELDF